MATIKQATYVFAKTLNLPSSYLFIRLFNSISVGSLMLGRGGSITIAPTEIKAYKTASSTAEIIYTNGAWIKDEYRTWVLDDSAIDATDGTQEWIDANLYLYGTKFVRLIPSGEVKHPTEIPYNIIISTQDFVGEKYVTGVYATIDGTEKTLYEIDEYIGNNFNFALYSKPSKIRVEFTFEPTQYSVEVYALSAYGVEKAEQVTYSGYDVIYENDQDYYFDDYATALFFHSSELD